MATPERVRRGQRIRAEHLNQLAKAVRESTAMAGPGMTGNIGPAGALLSAGSGTYNPTVHPSGFFARIVGSALAANGQSYTYSWEAVSYSNGAWSKVTDGATGTAAVNLAETPSVEYQFSPVKTGTVVRMLGTGEPVLYTFESATNADTALNAAFVELAQCSSTPGQYNADTWSITANKGYGVKVYQQVGEQYNPANGQLRKVVRPVWADPTGRIVAIGAEQDGGLVTQAGPCP